MSANEKTAATEAESKEKIDWPVIAFFALLLVNREYALKLFRYPLLLGGCAVSMGIGAVWIRRIVNFEF